MGHYRTGSSVVQSAGSAPLPAPVLQANEEDPDLSWTWTLADPFQWWIDYSPDGVSWTIEFDNQNGDARSASEDTPGFWRVYGVDSGGATITGVSNVVQTDV